MNVSRVKIIFVSLILLGISACSPIIKIEQPQKSKWIELSPNQSVGQTFTARYDGLKGIEVFIKPGLSGQGNLTLRLKNHPDDQNDVASSQIPIASFSKSRLYQLDFPSQSHSVNRDYYIILEVDGNSSLSIRTAPGETYQNGALYVNDEPIDSQLSFSLIYNSKLLFIGLCYELLDWIKYSLIAIFLYIIPGWALLSLLYGHWLEKSFMEKIGLSAGLSLAIYPIIILWTNLVGLRLGAFYAWLPPILGLLIIIWINRSWYIKPKFSQIRKLPIVDFAYFSITILIFAVRFWAIRNLPVPMWGDGFQHTVISQLLVDNKGLFNSWQPYAEIASFTYHFGFHSLVAIFHWISRISLPQATLWTGQLLNGLAVISLIPLVMKINKNKWGGIFTIVLAGLLFQMPMYYLNWGRYTQLAGQIIIVACVILAWETLENVKINWKLILLNCLGMAGLALTHYRVLIFAICFYFIFILLHIRTQFSNKIILTAIIGAGSLTLFSPWLAHVFVGKIPLIFASKFNDQVNQISSNNAIVDPIGDIYSYLPRIAWVLFAIAFIWGLYRRNKPILLIGLWWILILLVANPQWLRLPGAGALTNFAVFIAAYFPVGIILGGVFGIIIDFLFKYLEKLTQKHPLLNQYQIASIFLTLVFLITGVYYGRQSLKLIHPDIFALITYPDIKAMQWIKQNTPEDAKFLVNSFLAYNDTTSVGSDGGWWLQYLTLRPSTQPPINYGSETTTASDFTQSIKALTATIQENGVTNPKSWDLLLKNEVTHIYIGQKHGRVNYSGSVIEPLELLKDERFTPIYHEDRVWVFEVVR